MNAAAVADARTSSSSGQGILLALVVIGAAAFIHGLMQPEPWQAWAIYLVNLLFWSSLAIAGPAASAMLQLTEARWSPSIKRVALTTGGFLPFSFVLFLLFFLGMSTLYPWVNNPALVEKKSQWLNVPFFVLRNVVGVLLLYWVAIIFTRAVFAEGTGDEAAALARRNRLSGILLTLFVLVLSLWGFDLIMSLDPVWYSGLLGGYFVVSTLYIGFGLVTYLSIRANARGLTHVSPSAIQDIAKLTFAMCVMWLYFFFSQYLVIWYGNVPVETRFFLRRFFDDPWRTMAFVIFVAGWLVPFSYLLKRLTGRPPAAHKPLVVILFMGWVSMFLERVLQVYPAITSTNRFPIGLREALVTAGFFGLFVLSRNRMVARYASRLDQGR
ncbi:MAG TPA: hypothetical protein VL948_13355 [Verrucomicrobiae bacterium]|jgi:hypothetical protein|nr:hypothetical protein [Verrucomicrobiae bacterium]